jgi:hypothetical protein
MQFSEEFALAVRSGQQSDVLQSLNRVLATHHASLKCQFDAFADYVAEAEAKGVPHYPLYAWTKETIEDPAKKAKYLRSHAVYVNTETVYSRQVADALDADLSPLVDGTSIERLAKYDTNPANNPQPPKR